MWVENTENAPVDTMLTKLGQTTQPNFHFKISYTSKTPSSLEPLGFQKFEILCAQQPKMTVVDIAWCDLWVETLKNHRWTRGRQN